MSIPGTNFFALSLRTLAALLLLLARHAVQCGSILSVGDNSNQTQSSKQLELTVRPSDPMPTFTAFPLQMKKIGLEIPESTRKDMESLFVTSTGLEFTSQPPSKVQSTSRRRILCSSGYFSNTTSGGSCSPCSNFNPKCAQCSEAAHCTLCASGFYVASPDDCYGCNDIKCVTCSSFSVCTSCEPPYVPTGAYCFCPNSFNNNIPNCVSYDNACSCNRCENNYAVTGTPSVDAICQLCGAAYYSVGYNCLPCTLPCATCANTTNTCLTCDVSAPLFLSSYTCIASCGPGKFYNSIAKTCDTCSIMCYSGDCNGSSGSDCLSCGASHYLLTNNTCDVVCPNGQYADSSRKCMPCDGTCYKCSGPAASECTECDPTYLTSSNRCASICPSNCFPNTVTHRCDLCDPSCDGCTGPNNNCIACAGTYFRDPLTNICGMTCPSHYFPEPVARYCNPCHTTCSECTSNSASSCTSCDIPNFLNPNGVCGIACPSHYFANTVTKKCEICDSSCNNCGSSGAFSCTSCIAGYFLNPDGQCQTSCPITHAPDGPSHSCIPCHSFCLTCSIGNNNLACVTCPSGRHPISGNFCAKVCPLSQYYNQATDQCLDCNSVCISGPCVGPSLFQCNCPILVNYDGSCVSACPPGTYTVAPNCTKCDLSCQTCSGGAANQCLTCNSTLYFTTDHECKSSCEQKEYSDSSNICHLCDTSCNSCNGSGAQACTSCSVGMYIHLGNQCVATCPQRFSSNLLTMACDPCSSMCDTCSLGNNKFSCLTCPSGRHIRADKFCELNCSTNQIYNQATDACEPCGSVCETCSLASNNSSCLTCPSGRYLRADKFCQLNCSAKQFYNQALDSCDPCHTSCSGSCNGSLASNCVNCSDYKNCTECDTANGYILVNGTCVKKTETAAVTPTSTAALELVVSRFNTSSQTWRLAFSKSISVDVDSQLKLKGSSSVKDSTSKAFYDCDGSVLTCEIINIVENGFSIKFTSSVDILGGTASFKNTSSFRVKDKATLQAFGGTNVEVGIRSTTLASVGSGFDVGVTTISYVRIPSMVLMAASPAASIFLDLLINDLLVLSLYSGPKVYYPDLILNTVPLIDLLPFQIPGCGGYLDWTQKEKCEASETFEQAGVECYFLYNYGQDFIVLLITLGINIVVSLPLFIQYLSSKSNYSSSRVHVGEDFNGDNSSMQIPVAPNNSHRVRSKKKISSSSRNEQRNSFGISRKMHEVFGVPAFFLKVFGMQQELYIYIFINFVNSTRVPQSILSLVVSFLFLGQLAWSISCIAKSCLWVHENRNILRQSVLARDETMSDVLQKHEHSCSHVDFVWENMKIPTRTIQCWAPLAPVIRMIFLSLILLRNTNEPVGQILFGILIEVGYLIFFIKSNIRASKIEFWAETGTQGLTVVYLGMKLMTTFDMEQDLRQKKLGMCMFIMLVLIIVTQLSVFIYILISLLVEKIRQYKVKHVNNKDSSKANIDNSIEVNPKPSRSHTVSRKVVKQNIKRTLALAKSDKKPERKNRLVVKRKVYPEEGVIESRNGKISPKVYKGEETAMNSELLVNINKGLIAPRHTNIPNKRNRKVSPVSPTP